MQKTHYFCDICKQEFKPQELKQAHFNGKNIDLCEQCNKDLTSKFIDLVDEKAGVKK